MGRGAAEEEGEGVGLAGVLEGAVGTRTLEVCGFELGVEAGAWLLGGAEEGAAEEIGGGGATEDDALTDETGATDDDTLMDDTGAAGVDEGVGLGAADETGALPGVGLNNKVKR